MVIAGVAAVSVVLLIYSLAAQRSVRMQAATAEDLMRESRVQAQQVERERERLLAEMTPADVASLQSAHKLVDRKSFSWTRLFNDLESAMPQTVRVTRISVRDVAQNRNITVADVGMTVIGRTADDVTNMIAQMNASGVFLVTPLTQTADARGRGVEWTLQVNYMPAPLRTTPSLDKQVSAQSGVARIEASNLTMN